MVTRNHEAITRLDEIAGTAGQPVGITDAIVEAALFARCNHMRVLRGREAADVETLRKYYGVQAWGRMLSAELAALAVAAPMFRKAAIEECTAAVGRLTARSGTVSRLDTLAEAREAIRALAEKEPMP